MLRDKLSRFSGQISRAGAAQISTSNQHRLAPLENIPGAGIYSGSSGDYLRVDSDFDESYMHGRATIRSYFDIRALPAYEFIGGDLPELKLDKFVFIDTETTGLGGSGTVPFLIGLGSVTASGFQVRQYFLPDYADEAAMLEAVRAEIKNDSVIVSYNGRAFDLPIVLDRLILHRIERHLNFAEHIDLLVHARRLFRRRLQDCTLANVEREVLGYYRYDDIPGYLVPSIYFDWLATGQTSDLRRVLKHNLDDIVSLYFLLHHINDIYQHPEEFLTEPDDIYSLARIYAARRDHGAVFRFLEEFEPSLYDQHRHDILFLEALSCKRGDNLSKAVEIWENIASGGTSLSFFARIELAKYYEHRVRDLTAAREQAELAREICPATDFHREALKRRTERLARKLPS
ncbi:conserved hypothetical protein [Candidatus Zixiibacteriota bacterium]|nr:conserved hypothetical protein [candidate division Zixibacteria bacterium]